MNKNFWKNKRILITGFEGFLGSNLVKELLKTEAKVVGVDIQTFRKETVLLPTDYKKMHVCKGNITNYKRLQKILQEHSINIIFHLAAEALVGPGQKDPRKTFKTNITGTCEVLEAARQQGNLQAIIVASSDKAYGYHQKLPYREDAPLLANHPYDVSKSCADLIAQTYFHTYRLPVAVTRCGNIYGPGDFHFSRIVPETIRCAHKKETLLIRSNGKFTRDYIFIDDVVAGYILVAEKLKSLSLAGEAFNLSNERPKTVIDIVNMIYRFMDKKPNYRILNKARYEIKEQSLSAAKAHRILGWKPTYNLRDGLKKTLPWYLTYFSKSNA